MSDQPTTAYTVAQLYRRPPGCARRAPCFNVPGNYSAQFLHDRPRVRKIGVYRDDQRNGSRVRR